MRASTTGIPHLLACLLLVAAVVGAYGCSEGGPVDPGAQQHSGPRIVSLSPALSQVLIDLGQGEMIVGCTPWAPAGLEGVPVVGDLLEPDLERISVVNPDLVLVQPTQMGVDPGLRALAEQRGWEIVSWHLNRLEDIDRVLDELPAVLGGIGADQETVQRLVVEWRVRRDDVLVPDPVLAGLGTTVILFGVDPPQVFGTETYLDDVLQALGGRNAITRSGYLELSLEDLAVLEPDALVVLSSDPVAAREGAELLRTHLGSRAEAIEIYWVPQGDLLFPGTRLLDGVENLRSSISEQQS